MENIIREKNDSNNPFAKINPIRYRSYYYDIETGLYYLQTRYYNPAIGAFISPDSTDYLDPETIGGLNLYTYCNNNPVMGIDPTGHFFITAMLIGAGIGALVGVASQGASDVLSNLWNHGFNTSEWKFSSWQTYVGAAVGGAVGGALTPFLGPVSTAAINGAVSSLVGMGLENATGATNYSAGEILATSLFVASFSGMTAGLLDKIKIPGITSGKGNLSAIQKQINTKLVKNQISKISMKTIGKMLLLETVNSAPSSFINSFINGLVLSPNTSSF